MTPPTATQTTYQAALKASHLELLRAVRDAGSAYEPLGTAKSQRLIELYHAGYLYSERAIFYLTDAGREFLQQTEAAGAVECPA